MEITMNTVEDVSEMEEFIFVVKVMELTLVRHSLYILFIINKLHIYNDIGQRFLKIKVLLIPI